MELRNFRRGRHLYSAGRPSRWASAHILVLVSFTLCRTSSLVILSTQLIFSILFQIHISIAFLISFCVLYLLLVIVQLFSVVSLSYVHVLILLACGLCRWCSNENKTYCCWLCCIVFCRPVIPTAHLKYSVPRSLIPVPNKQNLCYTTSYAVSRFAVLILILLLLLHPFNGLISWTTWVSRHQKGKPFWILLEQEMMWWQWRQLDRMQIIFTSLQTDNHASTSPLSCYRPDALPATQPTLSKHWSVDTNNRLIFQQLKN